MPKAFRISFFGGMVPRTSRRTLSESQAQIATNTRLTSGHLEPLRELVLVSNPQRSGAVSIYKLTQAGQDYWLAWASEVDAAKGPIAGDTTNRTYFTGSAFEPRVTDFTLATTSQPYPTAWYVLGVTPPVTAASLSHAGGAGAAVSRAFVYTFVTQWGEESAPSPTSAVVTGKTDGTWTFGAGPGMDTAPLNSYNITNAVWAAGTLTLTVTSTFGLRAGEYVTLSGLAPSLLNVSWKVATVTSTTVFTITMVDPGVITDTTGAAARDAPHNTTGMTKNVYWTQTDSAGNTTFQLVATGIAVATTSTTVAGSATPLEELQTEDWVMPPVDLQGVLFHPSGAAVGFSKNQVCFSEPYAPYAWPIVNQFTVDYDIVGIGIYATAVVVATKGKPYIAAGVDPDSVTLTVVDQPWPCLAKRSVVSMDYGVFYATPQGLAMLGIQGATLVTKALFTQKEWEAYEPSTFLSAPFSGRYVTSFQQDNVLRHILIIDPGEMAAVTTASTTAAGLYGDQKTGRLYVLAGDLIYEWDSDSGSLMTYDWMSRELVSPQVFNPGAAKMDADFELTPEQSAALIAARAIVIAANQALITANAYDIQGSGSAIGEEEVGGVSFEEAPPDTSEQLTFQLWIDNELKFSKMVTTSQGFTLPSGYKADAVAVRVSGNVKVLGVVVADTMKSLRNA